MLSWDLHATFAGLHPLGSIAPDQSGCIVTDEVHDPISNKLCRGGLATGSANTTTEPDTTRRFTSPRLLSTRLLTEERWASDHSRTCYSVTLHY